MDEHQQRLTLGLPCIHNEEGEVRDFLPEVVHAVADSGADVVLETGYGSRLGRRAADYTGSSGSVRFVDRSAAFRSDVVLMLRPSDDALDSLPSGATFVSMLHFPTHPDRARSLKERGIHAIALDLLVDDDGSRMVENMRAVAWNGLQTGFDVLERLRGGLAEPGRGLVRVTVLGAGLVGKHAVEAATKFGDIERADRLGAAGAPGVEVTVLGRNMTGDRSYMRHRLRVTDVLVDATLRDNPSRPLIDNALLGDLPALSVVVDLAVDPYLPDDHPPVARGIEGIPRGDLNTYVFPPDHPAWDRLPVGIATRNRRWVASCYSWPGIHPVACMEHYGRQVTPLLQSLLARGGGSFLRADGGLYERALYRGSLAAWADRIG